MKNSYGLSGNNPKTRPRSLSCKIFRFSIKCVCTCEMQPLFVKTLNPLSLKLLSLIAFFNKTEPFILKKLKI